MTPYMNQNTKTPFVLQLMLCHMMFYSCSAILFLLERLQPSLKGYQSQGLKYH